MGDFNQPQQKYAGTGENRNIAMPVIFYPVIKTLGINIESRKQFCKYVKIVKKSGNLQNFMTIFTIFAKLIFALKFRILVLTRPN